MRGAAAGVMVLLPWVPAWGLERSLETALIARVRVLDIRPLEPGEHPHLRSEARVEVLESFRGPGKGEVVRVRFDDGTSNRIVHAGGEECLVFAGADFEGAFATMEKTPIDAGYPSLAAEVRQRFQREHVKELDADGEGEKRPSIFIRIQPPSQGSILAQEALIEVRVENRGQLPFRIHKGLRTDLRERFRGGLERAREPYDRLTLTFEPESESTAPDPTIVMALLRKISEDQLLRLLPGEACEASITVAEALPQLSGKHRFNVWASTEDLRSNWIALEVDFGDPKTKPLEIGPLALFRKVGPLHGLLRFAREHAVILGLFAGALSLAFFSRLRPGERRRRG